MSSPNTHPPLHNNANLDPSDLSDFPHPLPNLERTHHQENLEQESLSNLLSELRRIGESRASIAEIERRYGEQISDEVRAESRTGIDHDEAAVIEKIISLAEKGNTGYILEALQSSAHTTGIHRTKASQTSQGIRERLSNADRTRVAATNTYHRATAELARGRGDIASYRTALQSAAEARINHRNATLTQRDALRQQTNISYFEDSIASAVNTLSAPDNERLDRINESFAAIEDKLAGWHHGEDRPETEVAIHQELSTLAAGIGEMSRYDTRRATALETLTRLRYRFEERRIWSGVYRSRGAGLDFNGAYPVSYTVDRGIVIGEGRGRASIIYADGTIATVRETSEGLVGVNRSYTDGAHWHMHTERNGSYGAPDLSSGILQQIAHHNRHHSDQPGGVTTEDLRTQATASFLQWDVDHDPLSEAGAKASIGSLVDRLNSRIDGLHSALTQGEARLEELRRHKETILDAITEAQSEDARDEFIHQLDQVEEEIEAESARQDTVSSEIPPITRETNKYTYLLGYLQTGIESQYDSDLPTLNRDSSITWNTLINRRLGVWKIYPTGDSVFLESNGNTTRYSASGQQV